MSSGMWTYRQTSSQRSAQVCKVCMGDTRLPSLLPHPVGSTSVGHHQLSQHTCCPVAQPGSCRSFSIEIPPHPSNAEQIIFWGHLLSHSPWGRLCSPRMAVTSHPTQCCISNMMLRPFECWGLSVPLGSGLTLMAGKWIDWK